MNSNANEMNPQDQTNNPTNPHVPPTPPEAASAPEAPAVEPAVQAGPAEMPASAPPPPSGLQKLDASFGGTLGEVELLTEEERANLFACETVIDGGWQTFVQVGLAFAQIRDGRLYKEEFNTFEAYCRVKWEYGRHYINRLISAAQVFTFLVTSCHQKPERESQVRPLIGLTAQEAQQAWNLAIERAGGRKLSARVVKQAVHEMQRQPGEPHEPKPKRQSKAELRKGIEAKFGQLLLLAGQTANAQALTAIIEELHGETMKLFA
jgi:hypothetical protein